MDCNYLWILKIQQKIIFSVDIEFWDNTSAKHLSLMELVILEQIMLNYVIEIHRC